MPTPTSATPTPNTPTPTPATPTPATDTGLLAHWPLDEDAGIVAADAVGNSDGTVVGAAWVGGIAGNALDFDGVDDHVVMANTAALDITDTEITLAAWIYPHNGGATGGSRAISKRTDGGGSDVYSMYTYQSRLRFRLDGQDLISAQTFTPGEWLHVAMVYDGVDKRIYLDGVLDPATPQAKTDAIDASSRAVHLGMREGENRRFNGLLDDVRIYERALDAAEVAALADTGNAPPATPTPSATPSATPSTTLPSATP